MADSVSVKSLTIPVSMLTTILGGSAWLTSTRAELDNLIEKVEINRITEKELRNQISRKIDSIRNMERLQAERLSRIEGKQDIILHSVQQLEKRVK